MKGNKRINLDFWFFMRLISFVLLGIFLLYPFSTLIIRSFMTKDVSGITLANYIKIFTKKFYYTALFNSLYVALIPTIICTLIGVPMAYILTRYNIPGKNVIHILIIMSLLSPPFIGAYAWIMLFGRSGFITTLVLNWFGITLPTIYGKAGIISVFVFKLYPYVYLYVSGALTTIDSSLEEAGESLGSSKLRRIMTVSLPVVMPSIAAGP
ncbi:MAG: ABC transporter permease subunit [Clostridiales bacterium]|nr:ABC transporter permease subunit [Clostridiales bacterium]